MSPNGKPPPTEGHLYAVDLTLGVSRRQVGPASLGHQHGLWEPGCCWIGRLAEVTVHNPWNGQVCSVFGYGRPCEHDAGLCPRSRSRASPGAGLPVCGMSDPGHGGNSPHQSLIDVYDYYLETV